MTDWIEHSGVCFWAASLCNPFFLFGWIPPFIVFCDWFGWLSWHGVSCRICSWQEPDIAKNGRRNHWFKKSCCWIDQRSGAKIRHHIDIGSWCAWTWATRCQWTTWMTWGIIFFRRKCIWPLWIWASSIVTDVPGPLHLTCNSHLCLCRLSLVIAPACWAKHFAFSASTVHKLPRIPKGLTAIRSSHLFCLGNQQFMHFPCLVHHVLCSFPPCTFCGLIGIAHFSLSFPHLTSAFQNWCQLQDFLNCKLFPKLRSILRDATKGGWNVNNTYEYNK